MYRLLLFFIMLISSPVVLAASAGLSFSSSGAEIGLSTGGDYTDTVDFGFTAYYNKDADILITADMLTALDGDGSSPWLFSLGAKGFGLLLQRQEKAIDEVRKETHVGVAISLQFGYKFLTAIPLAIIADTSYSPNILNTGSVNNIFQLSVLLEAMLSPSAIAQVGYRQYRVNFKTGIHHLGNKYKNIDDGIIVGIKLRF